MRAELYYSYISEADFAPLERMLPLLPPERRASVAAHQDPAARARSIAVTALLQQAVSSWEKGVYFSNAGVGFCTIPATALGTPFPYWEAEPGGRPFPEGIPTDGGRVWVSLSHSGGHLLVAVADHPLGADIQCLAHPALSPRRFERLDGRIRHPAEPPAGTPAEVALRWAAKEAAVKLSGEGLSCPLTRLQAFSDRVLSPDGQAHPLLTEETPAFVLAAVVKVSIPAG